MSLVLMLRKKTNKIFYKILAITSLSFVVLLFPAFILFDKLFQVWLSWQGELKTICGCIVNFVFFDHPFLFSLLALVFVGLIVFIFWGANKTIKIRLVTNRFIKINLSRKKKFLSSKLKIIARELGLDKKIIEVINPKIDIFCYGFLNQKICISSSLVKKFSKEELRAVLLHEQYHLMAHENIKLFIVSAIKKILFFVPGLSLLIKKYSIFSELTADEWAIKNSADSSSVAKAIYKILEKREAVSYSFVPSFGTSIEERINKIVDSDYSLDKKVFTGKKVLANVFIFIFILSFSFFVHSTKLNTVEHDDEMCEMDMGSECASDEEALSCEQDININELLCHD